MSDRENKFIKQIIDHALKVYLNHLKRRNLKRELKEEALANAKEDQKNLNEWFSLDREAWDSIKLPKIYYLFNQGYLRSQIATSS